MSQCLTKMGHSCGTRDGLQVFEQEDGSIDGYCYSCSTYVQHPYGTPKKAEDMEQIKKERLTKTTEEVIQEIAEISTYVTVDLPERKLRKSTLEHFGIKIGLSEKDGKTPMLHYYPYTDWNGELKGYKVRLIETKKMWFVGSIKDCALFGWNQAISQGSKRLIITEGELDAVSVHRILELYTKEQYQDSKPAVVSLPNGASAAKRDISRAMPEIKKYFKQVSVCFDSDVPGKKATDEVCKMFPEITSIILPDKDANECLMKGVSKSAYAAITFNAVKPKNTRLVKGSSLRDQAKVRPEMGLSWPWEGFTRLTRGIRRGETYYFGAGVKLGKSELVNSIATHMMVKHDLPVFLCKPEESMAKTYQMLVGKVAGRIFHDPDIEFDVQAFDEAEPLVGDKAIIVDNYQFVSWDGLKADINYAVNIDGVKDVIIDPITCLTVNMNSAEANEFLTGMSAELSSMSKDSDFTSYLFCHLKAPVVGPPHERGGEVLSTQFTGSRGMMRSCNMMVGLQGNKDPELDARQRNMRKLVVLEDRNLGVSGGINLYWDNKTGLFNEVVV